MDLKVQNLILNKKFDSKTIKHFFIKQQTSLFLKNSTQNFFLNTQCHIRRNIKIIILLIKKFQKKNKKKMVRLGQM